MNYAGDIFGESFGDSSESSDGWYTPASIIEKARIVMGGIDLDPASCEAANAVVRATRYYTKIENGLAQPWAGRLWINPPYSAPTAWARRAIAEHAAGNVSASMFLVNSYTETGWFQDMCGAATILFFRGRLQFWHPEKLSGRNRMGQALCYIGPTPDRFVGVFEEYGRIMRKA